MKKAVNQWCFPADWSWERVFDLARGADFQGMEICVDYVPFSEAMRCGGHEGLLADIARSVGSTFENSKSLRFDSPDKEFRRIAALAADHDIAISSLLTISQFYYSLIHQDAGIRQTGIDLVKQLIDRAALMGAPNVLIVPGVVTSRIGYEDAVRRLEESLWILKAEAEQRQVGLGLENVWGKFLYSPLEMREFVDRFESPYVGVHFDVGNVLQYGYPDQWIRILGGNRLLNVHLKDYLESVNNIRGFTHLFQGDVPWERTMQSLRDVGYEGYLIAEVPPYRYCPEEGIRDISRKLDILMGLG